MRESIISTLFDPDERSVVYRILVVVLLLCCLAGGVAAAPGADEPLAQEDIDPDDVLLSIDVETNGDATWTIEYRVRLATDEDEQAFESFREDLEADPEEYESRFHDRMVTTADAASDATGREMTIDDVSVSAERRELPREYGVVTYSFRWSNFAAVDDDRLVIGDAIEGLFLDDETTLRIAWPAEYELLEASPTPSETRDRAVLWNGPIDFGDGEPRVAVGSASWSLLAIGVVGVGLLAVAGGVALLLYRRRTSGGGSERPDESVDEELLSNEERVLRLVEERGGRMKQKELTETLGWTDAQTSQVTKELREEGKLEGFRLGRENVLSLPGETDE